MGCTTSDPRSLDPTRAMSLGPTAWVPVWARDRHGSAPIDSGD